MRFETNHPSLPDHLRAAGSATLLRQPLAHVRPSIGLLLSCRHHDDPGYLHARQPEHPSHDPREDRNGLLAHHRLRRYSVYGPRHYQRIGRKLSPEQNLDSSANIILELRLHRLRNRRQCPPSSPRWRRRSPKGHESHQQPPHSPSRHEARGDTADLYALQPCEACHQASDGPVPVEDLQAHGRHSDCGE